MAARLDRQSKRLMEPKMKWARLERGPWKYPAERIVAHTALWCEGEICCIHSPTEHHMRSWRQHWRGDKQFMERLCSHGVGHPDPDDLTVRLMKSARDHGCCIELCCVEYR